MSDQSHSEHTDHIAHHVRRYLIVFVALVIGTILTVLASYIHFPSREINVAVAILIASCKAFLVAGYFMHLISEKQMIYGVLGFTFFFAAALMALTIWSYGDFPPLTVTH
jgi:cytochrome c oxidase subunit 4